MLCRSKNAHSHKSDALRAISAQSVQILGTMIAPKEARKSRPRRNQNFTERLASA